MNLPLRLPVADCSCDEGACSVRELLLAAACWVRAVLIRSMAPCSVVVASEDLAPVDMLGSGVDVPDSSADDAKDGRQKEPKASWYGSVPLVMDTGDRNRRTVVGGGGSSTSSRAGIMAAMARSMERSMWTTRRRIPKPVATDRLRFA